MTDQIMVDFNSRDDRGLVPAARRRIAFVPIVGSIVDAADDEDNRCLARVVRVSAASITLEPLWQTFATPEQSRVLPGRAPQPFRISWANPTSIFVDAAGRGRRTWSQTSTTSGPPVLAMAPSR